MERSGSSVFGRVSERRVRGGMVAAAIAALGLFACVARVEAYPSYDDGGGVGCVQCHASYFDDPLATPFGSLHNAHLTKFGITSCGVCHQNAAGGDIPVLTYWSAEGFGCAGCHGQDYGQTGPTTVVDPVTSNTVNLAHGGQPKATAYGLRRLHAAAFAANNEPDHCSSCHFPGSQFTGDPTPAPAIFPETVRPPYYNGPKVNLTDPCDGAQESWEGVPPGLDNDGNGFPDMLDSACQAFVSTTSTTVVTTTSTSTTTFPGTARRVTVYPGQSIQDAVNAIAPRGTVYVMPGTYQEDHDGTNAVTVSKDGVRLIARSKPSKGLKVVLQPHPNHDQRNGIVVQGTTDDRIDGFRVKGFTIQGFPNNGILTRYLDNFRIERNESIGNLENGIWPTLSANGLVKKNVSYGSEDSALWVEASENVRVLNNELYDSPTGLEITVSNNIVARKNDVHDNSTGIGLYHPAGAGLPPLQPIERNGYWDITDNYVHDNNKVNDVTGGLVSLLPPGGGILVIGVDHVNVVGNRIENNDFYGIAVVDWALAVAPNPIDTAPDNNTFVNNDLNHNGTNPQPGNDPLLQIFAAFAADITYAVPFNTASHPNCFAGNTGTVKSLNAGYPVLSNHCP